MPEVQPEVTWLEVRLNGQPIRVKAGSSVLSALQNAGSRELRRSLSGEARGPLCGMGVCFECRVSVNGVPVRSCQTPVQAGQRIETLEAGSLKGEVSRD